MNPSSTRAPRPRGDERGSTTTTTTLTTTTTTRRDARSTRTPRPAVAPDRVSRTPTPPARSIETRSIGRHHHHPRRHHRPLATTTRRRTDRRSTTKTSRLFFSSRLRRRLRLRTVHRVVGRAPPSPHPRHPHRITRSRSRPYVRSIARASPIARTRADRRPSHRAVSFRVERDAPSFLRACVRVTTRARRAHSQSIIHSNQSIVVAIARAATRTTDRCRARPSLAFDTGTCPTPSMTDRRSRRTHIKKQDDMFGHMENPIPRPPSCLFIVVYTKTKTTSGCFVHDDDDGASVVERARETPAREGGGGDDGAAREGIVVRSVHRSVVRSFVPSVGRSLTRSLARSVDASNRRLGARRRHAIPSRVRERARARTRDGRGRGARRRTRPSERRVR